MFFLKNVSFRNLDQKKVSFERDKISEMKRTDMNEL